MPRKRTVVVVEDEDAIRRAIVDALRISGYEPVEAADGVAGLKEARRGGVDLVLLDLLMPKKDGFEVLQELRITHPSLPVIILTARGSEDDRVRGLRMGADDYITKPFQMDELLLIVERVGRVVALRREIAPQARQKSAATHFHDRTQHFPIVALAAPVEAMLAADLACTGQRGLVGRTHRRRQMRFYGFRGYAQGASDGLVRLPLNHAAQNVHLPGSEHCQLFACQTSSQGLKRSI